MCFVYFSQLTATVSPQSTNQLVLVQTELVKYSLDELHALKELVATSKK
jgi:hypothetical protein